MKVILLWWCSESFTFDPM